MTAALFHTELFVPPVAKAPLYEGALTYSQHALREAESDRYGGIELPQEFHCAGAQLIEAEVLIASQRVTKQVWRQKLDESRDLVLVIGEGGLVRTVWINLKGDKHRTLDKSKYWTGRHWRAAVYQASQAQK